MAGLLVRTISYVRSKIAQQDRYGKPITLLYNGEDSYKTCCGGWTTIVLIFFILAYSLVLFRMMLNREQIEINVSTSVIDLLEENEPHYISRSGFDIAVGWTNTSISPLSYSNISEYLTFEATLITEISENSVNTKTLGIIQLAPWDELAFEEIHDSLNSLLIHDQFFCLNTDELFLQGNFISNNYTYIQITAKPCSSGTWQSASDIDTAVLDTSIVMIYTPGYFNGENFEDPIRSYLDFTYEYKIDSALATYSNAFVMQNKVDLQDDFIQFGDSKSGEFYTISRVQDSVNTRSSGNFFDLTIRLDNRKTLYERRVFSFLDLIGQVGGVNEIIEIFWVFFIGMYSEKLFQYSIVSKIYHFNRTSAHHDKTNNSKEDHTHSNQNIYEAHVNQSPYLHEEAKIPNPLKNSSNTIYSKNIDDHSNHISHQSKRTKVNPKGMQRSF